MYCRCRPIAVFLSLYFLPNVGHGMELFRHHIFVEDIALESFKVEK
jgi:hypothetical protein